MRRNITLPFVMAIAAMAFVVGVEWGGETGVTVTDSLNVMAASVAAPIVEPIERIEVIMPQQVPPPDGPGRATIQATTNIDVVQTVRADVFPAGFQGMLVEVHETVTPSQPSGIVWNPIFTLQGSGSTSVVHREGVADLNDQIQFGATNVHLFDFPVGKSITIRSMDDDNGGVINFNLNIP